MNNLADKCAHLVPVVFIQRQRGLPEHGTPTIYPTNPCISEQRFLLNKHKQTYVFETATTNCKYCLRDVKKEEEAEPCPAGVNKTLSPTVAHDTALRKLWFPPNFTFEFWGFNLFKQVGRFSQPTGRVVSARRRPITTPMDRFSLPPLATRHLRLVLDRAARVHRTASMPDGDAHTDLTAVHRTIYHRVPSCWEDALRTPQQYGELWTFSVPWEVWAPTDGRLNSRWIQWMPSLSLLITASPFI